jgi:hypothetical protein
MPTVCEYCRVVVGPADMAKMVSFKFDGFPLAYFHHDCWNRWNLKL